MNCLIIEDEPIASEILEDYVKQVPVLNLVGIHRNALDALKDLQNGSIDLLFLDIHLPMIKGLQFFRTLANPPKVIVTTAYHEYAVESFELEAVDYLLKPFSFDRFLAAVNKVHKRESTRPSSTPRTEDISEIFVSVAKRKVKVRLADIRYVEGSKEYVRIFLQNDVIKTKLGLTQLEQMLPPNSFSRVHRSFIVSLEHIDAYDHSFIEIGQQFIPIGKLYKEGFLSRMK